MVAYLQRMSHKFSLFDAPLVYNFSAISKTEKADLTKVFDNTLVKYEPYNAVVSFPVPHPSQRRPSNQSFNPIVSANLKVQTLVMSVSSASFTPNMR